MKIIDVYCPECGTTTKHSVTKGYYATSEDLIRCTKCGNVNRGLKNIPEFIKI